MGNSPNSVTAPKPAENLQSQTVTLKVNLDLVVDSLALGQKCCVIDHFKLSRFWRVIPLINGVSLYTRMRTR